MSLRSGYKGFKKLLPGLKIIRPGTLGIDNTELSKTFFPRSEQALLGAKNIAYYEGATLVGDTTNGFNLTAGGSSIIAKLEHNTNYVAQRKSGQGDRFRIVLFMNKPSYTAPETTASQLIVDTTTTEYEFNSGNFNYAVFSYVGSTGTPVPQDTAETMISLSGGSYAPYAMTNRELTDKVNLKESACTNPVGTESVNKLYKQGNVVYCVLSLTGVTAEAYGVLGNLPTGYRIPTNTTLKLMGSDGKEYVVYQDGNIVCTSALNNANVHFNASWITLQ